MTDAAIDELTAFAELWLFWQMMPPGRRDALLLRLNERFRLLLDGTGDKSVCRP